VNVYPVENEAVLDVPPGGRDASTIGIAGARARQA
jgi:hypothetical protein